MGENNKKIIEYLAFARSKLDLNNKAHKKARLEINGLIEELKQENLEIENENHIPTI